MLDIHPSSNCQNWCNIFHSSYSHSVRQSRYQTLKCKGLVPRLSVHPKDTLRVCTSNSTVHKLLSSFDLGVYI